MAEIRSRVPSIEEDRYLADDMAQAAALVISGQLSKTAQLNGYVIGAGDDVQ